MADDYWNRAKLMPPPVNSYRSPEDTLDARELLIVVHDTLKLLQDQSSLHQDAAFLSRLHYKVGRKFRHDIGYSYLRRTHTALVKYLNLKFYDTVKIFHDVLITNLNMYFPTRQMLEYLLVRLQTFAKMMHRIVECSVKAATYYLDRIQRDDATWLSLMPYATLSKIWYLSRHMLKNTCRWFNSLVKYRTRLKEVGVPFLPESYQFPDCMEAWLGLIDNDNTKRIESSMINSVANSRKGTSSADVVYSNYSGVSYANNNDDLGESVVRTKVNNAKTKTKIPSGGNRVQREMSTHSIKNVKDKKSLKKFIKVEELYREQEDEKSISSHISFMQWQSLKAVLKKLISTNRLSTPEFLKKLNKTWQERCEQA